MTHIVYRNANFIIAVLFFTMLIVVSPAYAANGLGNVDSVLEAIVKMMTGNTAKLIATVCIAVVGIGWMSGFIDLRKAAYCILGIGIAFGAPSLVNSLVGGSS
ncbi:TrbC/VirB2 family protein [Bartonella ancashensis]|uniref:Major pilus subunit of type IV secretion complex (VirB2) n=1 Tax=Bartonella ancashensis TaxID=1318743 RepID=A0A0M3T2K4_9HYPH|nr:TrbC/VirB2 family protein [Bartonella ancashensis]ALE03001.1 Major pilus subunit of type IV secretion complex (VirB2) [Bartonella ancashensis]